MAMQQYKGSLTLEWYNKNKSIILRDEKSPTGKSDIPAPKINWVNKDEAIFFEIDESEGCGVTPYWVDRSDIRVKETRPMIFQRAYRAVPKDRDLNEQPTSYEVVELDEDDPSIDNIIIRGDNLLALNTLKKMFDQKSDEEKVKCIYIDPPYNIGSGFKHYDDNMSHSMWLSLIRDRLKVLWEILKSDGLLAVQIDDKEFARLYLLMIEMCGESNLKVICVKMAEPTGVKMAHVINSGGIPKLKEYIILAKKNGISELNLENIPKEKWDSEYSIILLNFTYDDFKKITYIRDKEEDRPNSDIETCDSILSKIEMMNLQEYLVNNGILEDKKQLDFMYKNAWRIIRTCSTTGSAKKITDEKRKSTSKDARALCITTPRNKMYFMTNNYNFISSQPRIKILFANDYLTSHPGDFWQDIKTTGLGDEGGCDFPNGKKPEQLISRVIKMNTLPGDIVLDCFGGSGTTLAVANKLNRKWIGVEIGKHADTHIIPRIKRVLSGFDQNGISKEVGWQGGGSFKYYHLGTSIIEIDEHNKGDFNWQLGHQFIEESLLNSYDYVLDNEINLPATTLFDEDSKPKVGILKVGTKIMAAACSLNEPNDKREMMSIEEIEVLYNTLKNKYSPEFITIFTNRGVEMALDSKPEDLEIIKVPHAIFAELDK